MKKVIAVLLVLAMMLSLGGCALLETPKALAEARELIDNEEYDEAIDLLTSLEIYDQISDLLEEAMEGQQEQEQARLMEESEFLLGTWRCIDQNGMTITFMEDGTCQVETEYDVFSGPFGVEEENRISTPIDTFQVTEYEGAICLAAENYNYYVMDDQASIRFLREEDYEVLGPQTVEITMDNWEDYFELRFMPFFYRDDFGDVEYAGFGYIVYLREEYVDKLYHDHSAMDVAFKLECDSGYRYVTDPTQPDYIIGDVPPYYTSSVDTFTATLIDCRGSSFYVEGDAEYGAVCANLGSGGMPLDEGIFPVQENGRIIEVRGTIMIYP